MNPLPERQPNTGDKISDGLGNAADITDALKQNGINTGKAGFWLRLGSGLASLGASIFGRKT